MKFSKLLVFVLMSFSTLTVGQAAELKQLFKVSPDKVALYQADKKAAITINKIVDNKMVALETFTVNFPDGNITLDKSTPKGQHYVAFKYSLIGKVDSKYYFKDNEKKTIIIWDQEHKSVKTKIVPYPMILKSITKVNESLLLSAKMVIDDKSKNPCRNKYFIKKSLGWQDEICFGVGRDLLSTMDFPDTAVFKNGEQAALYFRNSGQLSIYNTGNGNQIEKYMVDLKNVEGDGSKTKPQFLDHWGGRLFLFKFDKNQVTVFKLDKKSWIQVFRSTGSFKAGTIVDNGIILLSEKGEIRVEKNNL